MDSLSLLSCEAPIAGTNNSAANPMVYSDSIDLIVDPLLLDNEKTISRTPGDNMSSCDGCLGNQTLFQSIFALARPDSAVFPGLRFWPVLVLGVEVARLLLKLFGRQVLQAGRDRPAVAEGINQDPIAIAPKAVLHRHQCRRAFLYGAAKH